MGTIYWNRINLLTHFMGQRKDKIRNNTKTKKQTNKQKRYKTIKGLMDEPWTVSFIGIFISDSRLNNIV